MRNARPATLWPACLFFPCCTLAQERYNPDSLLGILDQAKGLYRIELLRHLSRVFIASNRNC